MRFLSLRILGAGVISAIVVIVPGRDDRARLLDLDEPRLVTEQLVLGPHDVHVLCVGVDVVAEKDE
ncbi:hypothetical protein D3C83_289850 [compost metagenome]